MARLMSFSRERLFAVVDVESGGVKIAVVAVPTRGPASIIAHDHSPISLEERGEEQQAAWIAAQIAEVGSRVATVVMQKVPGAAIESIYCIFHVPFVRSFSASASAVYETDAYVDDALIGALAQQALAAQQEVDMANLLEASVVRVSLNGYPTANPTGKYARSVDVAAIVSDCNPLIRAKVTDAVQALFPASHINLRSALRAAQTSIRALRPEVDDFVLVGVGADASHVSTICSGVLDKQCTVKSGLRSILSLGGAGKDADEVLGYLRMLGREACEGEACQAVQTALASIEPEIVREFGEAMALIATPVRLPNTLILATHPDVAEWLGRFFSRIDFTQFTRTTLPFDVAILDGDSFAQYVVHGEHIDVSLLLGATLVNIETRS